MSLPFYVNPEQMARDKSEYARKGIARGKSVVTLECGAGVLIVAENPLKLQKLGEIYDRIAFAGVGRFSEFERLRKMGVQWADVEGYRFSRDDVRGKALANLYAQALGEEFTRSSKPFEVEIVVAEVGDAELAGQEANAIYQVSFDGAIQDTRATASSAAASMRCSAISRRTTARISSSALRCGSAATPCSAPKTATRTCAPETWR